MDWSGCELVETTGMVEGSTVHADAIFADVRQGTSLADLIRRYPALPAQTVEKVATYAAERLAWDTKTLVDWSNCKFVEQVPGRCSGAPTIVGTRIFPDTVAKYFWQGASVDEIHEDFPTLSRQLIQELIRYVRQQEASAA